MLSVFNILSMDSFMITTMLLENINANTYMICCPAKNLDLMDFMVDIYRGSDHSKN